MPTRFYLPPSGINPPVTPAFAGAWENVSSVPRVMLPTSKTGSASAERQASHSNGVQFDDTLFIQYISEPLSAQTISGTVKGIIGSRSNASTHNVTSQMVIRVVSGDGLTVRGTLVPEDTFADAAVASPPRWATSTGFISRRYPRGWAGAGAPVTSVNAQSGDRLVIEIGYRAHSVTTNGARIWLGDAGAADLPEDETSSNVAGDGWLEFSHTFAFGNTGDWVVVDTVGAVGLYDDSAVESGQTYEYRVIAINAAGESGPSNVVSVNVVPAGFPHLDVQGGVLAVVPAGSGFYLIRAGPGYHRVAGAETAGALVLSGGNIASHSASASSGAWATWGDESVTFAQLDTVMFGELP